MKIRYSLTLMAILAFGITQSCKKADKTVDMSNPFFSEYKTPFNLPPFESIKAEHYMPAFEKGLVEAREDLRKIIENKGRPTFRNTVEALDRMGTLLNRVSNVFFAQA
ncbi:MAG: peptidase M3, partial [Bacteroidales bacterium]|nr:peptidase M3 [Bacteroidales bacterium]